MTFENFTQNYLSERGMFENQVQAVIERAKQDKDNLFDRTMIGRWNDDIGAYPEITQFMFKFLINDVALEYIDEMCPKAWFRPSFTN